MPRIDEDLLKSVVYLYPSEAEAEDGKRLGGTGFIGALKLDMDSDSNAWVLFIVTNRHLVDNGNTVARINTLDGTFDIVSLDEKPWYNHPQGDDLAVCILELNREKHRISFIECERWMDRDFFSDFDLGVGDEVFALGRYPGLDGKTSNNPSARFGNISQMSSDPVCFEGGEQHNCIVVEMRSLSGYSGSPVFVEIAKYIPLPGHPISKISKYGGVRLVAGNLLLGINFCSLTDRLPVLDKNGKPLDTELKVEMGSGLAGIVPAWRLQDILVMVDFAKAINEIKAGIGLR